MTTYWAVPAGALGALGEMMKGDPPILLEADGGVYFWHPLVRFAEPAPGPDDNVLVEQSAPALAAVVARHEGAAARGVVAYRWGAPILTLAAENVNLQYEEGEDFIGNVRSASHALAVLVCFLANQATRSDRFAPREVTP